jgi:mannonate dehydratase
MKLSFRWYGPDDPVTLPRIRQIPALEGIVTALYDVPVGEVWPVDKLIARKAEIEAQGLEFVVVESIPLHESIKLGLPERDRYIDNYRRSIAHMGAIGVTVLCYNFMPVFDWTRTHLAHVNEDGSTALTFRQADLDKIDLALGTHGLPGWADAYTAMELSALRAAYEAVDAEQLFQNYAYFLRAVVPAAEEAGVYMAVHPDDPPWPIFGLPRVVGSAEQIRRVLDVVDSKHHGLTFCTGSLGASASNDLVAMAREFGGRVNFAHARNVRITGDRDFMEVAHPSRYGDVDMAGVLDALVQAGFDGPIRPDHGRMIWDEQGRPGYGLYDRALGATYITGVLDGLRHKREKH